MFLYKFTLFLPWRNWSFHPATKGTILSLQKNGILLQIEILRDVLGSGGSKTTGNVFCSVSYL